MVAVGAGVTSTQSPASSVIPGVGVAEGWGGGVAIAVGVGKTAGGGSVLERHWK